ncbi:MAG: hypothetical protein AB7F59_11755 [Bdellovibrionales bacterium]
MASGLLGLTAGAMSWGIARNMPAFGKMVNYPKKYWKIPLEELKKSQQSRDVMKKFKWFMTEVTFMSVIKTGVFMAAMGTFDGWTVFNILYNSALTLGSQGVWELHIYDKRDHQVHDYGESKRIDAEAQLKLFIISAAWAAIMISGQGAADRLHPFLSHLLSLEHTRIILPTLGHLSLGLAGYIRHRKYMREYEKERAEREMIGALSGRIPVVGFKNGKPRVTYSAEPNEPQAACGSILKTGS